MKSILGLVFVMSSFSAQASQLKILYRDFAGNISTSINVVTSYTATDGHIFVRAGENYSDNGSSVRLEPKVLRAAGFTIDTIISAIRSDAVIVVNESSDQTVTSVGVDETLVSKGTSAK